LTIDYAKLTSEQIEKIEALYEQWRAEALLLPEPVPTGKRMLDDGRHDPYAKLTHKYVTLMKQVIDPVPTDG
jgi:hypothetical protein